MGDICTASSCCALGALQSKALISLFLETFSIQTQDVQVNLQGLLCYQSLITDSEGPLQLTDLSVVCV